MIQLMLAPGGVAQVHINNDSLPSVSPSGDRVAFQSTRSGASDLYWMPVARGWPRRLTKDAGNNGNVVWSPSGDRVAFESDRSGSWQIYTQTLDASAAAKLVTDLPGGAQEPVFFPDGKRLAFTSEVDSLRQVFEVDLETGIVAQLTHSPGNKSEPALSLQGDRLAFLSDETGGLEIVVAGADGSSEKRITSFAEKEKRRVVNGLGWTPGGRLIFAANRGVQGRYFFTTAIYTLAPDGSDLRGVVRGILGHNNPSMARDGSLIAFDSIRYGGSDVFVVGSDGSGLRNLSASSVHDSFGFPTPDGEQVVFQSEREGQRDIYIMNRNGIQVRNLTRNPEDDRSPSVSRDGGTIVFASFRDSSWGDIYTMDLDGGNVVKVTPDRFFQKFNHFPISTAITPDGQTILFEAAPVLVQGEAQWDIWRIESDGSRAERLTHSEGTRRSSFPEVSPDGRSFLYFSNATGNFEIYRMSIDGGEPMPLTDNPAHDYYPTWSPQGDSIYFTSRRDGQPDVYRMTPSGSDIQRITHGTPEVFYRWGRVDLAGRNLWVHNRDGGLYIHRMELDGTDEVRLNAPWGPTAEDLALSHACAGFTKLGQPHWSWARNQIAFPGDCNGDPPSIYVYSVESDRLSKLDLGVNAPDSPAWSYAGDRIAFNGTDGSGDDRDLYIYDLDNGRTHRVTQGGAWGGWVTWSPDDLWLNGYGPSEKGSWDIFRVRTDGGERVRLNAFQDGDYYTLAESPNGGEFLYSMGNRLWRMTEEWAAEPALKGRLAAVMPRWAPDGRRYVFDGSEGFGWNLYLGDWRGGEEIPLTQRAERDSNATWSPDGKRIVYVCSLGEIDTLCVVDVETRRSRPLFRPGK